MVPFGADPSDLELAAELGRLGSATMGESGGVAAMGGIRAMWPGALVAGPAFTVECAPGDNLAVHVALPQAPAGSVLAVSVPGDMQKGYWGEVLTVAALSVGIRGLFIDGTVRDIDAIERRRFPVFARGVAIPGAGKLGPGSVGGPVALGNAVVRTGDWLIGDADGVVALAQERLGACLEAGRRRMAKEADMFSRLQSGATTLELLHLDGATVQRVGR